MKILCIFIITNLISLPLVIAQVATEASLNFGGDGTRGGAEVLFLPNGQPRLRDRIDPNVCTYTTGLEMRRKMPELDQLLHAISQVDWYFAAALKHDIDQLEICLTKDVIRLPEGNWDLEIGYDKRRRDQLAIRFLDSHEVRMHSGYIWRIPPEDRAEALIHESLHSFIPKGTSDRREKVSQGVKTLHRVAYGEVRTAEEMEALLRRYSGISFAFATKPLKVHREAIEWTLDSYSEKRNKVLSQNLEKLIHFDWADIKDFIDSIHSDLLSQTDNQRLYDFLIQSKGELGVFSRVVNFTPSSDKFDALLVSLNAATKISSSSSINTEALFEMIRQSHAMKRGPQIYDHMKNKSLRLQSGFRIMGVYGYFYLGHPQEVGLEVPALSVIPFTSVDSLTVEVAGFINLIVTWIKTDGIRGETLKKAVLQNPEFYHAFGVKGLVEQLHNMTAPIPREKTYLEQSLPEYVRGFRKVLKSVVSQEINLDTAHELDDAIDWARMGLQD